MDIYGKRELIPDIAQLVYREIHWLKHVALFMENVNKILKSPPMCKLFPVQILVIRASRFVYWFIILRLSQAEIKAFWILAFSWYLEKVVRALNELTTRFRFQELEKTREQEKQRQLEWEQKHRQDSKDNAPFGSFWCRYFASSFYLLTLIYMRSAT